MGGMEAISRPGRLLVGLRFEKLPMVLALGLLLASVDVARAGPGDPRISAEGFTSSRVCGECHEDIYNSWKNSLHAFALSDPIFDTALMQAVSAGGEEARKTCLRCHAPMTSENGDFLLQQGVTREGVSCDFCHSVTAVHLDGREKPYTLDLGTVKRSVLKSADSPAHEVEYSQLHETSEFCGGCHNFYGAGGVSIMGTYDEWKAGPYAAEGVQCQHCHMVLSEGRAVKQVFKRAGNGFHLHNLIHDTDQLRSALTVSILQAQRQGNELIVDVAVENVGSGHKVPTGIPTRQVLLTVEVEDSGRTLTQERRFRKVVADAKGRVLERDFEVLLYGAKVLNDTRIGPREIRRERFTFDLPRGERRAKVTASLTYSYSPVILRKQPMNINLGSTERIVY